MAPLPTGPQNGSDIYPEFTWTPLIGASRYELWVDDLTRRKQKIIHQTDLTVANFTPTTPLAAGRYRFWVRGFDVENTRTAWSSPWTFHINLSPEFTSNTGNTTDPRPQLTWSAVPNIDHYELWIRGLSQTQNPYIHETNITDTQFTPAADLPIGAYYAWVRGIYADDSTTNWSLAERFRVVTQPTFTAPVGRTDDRTPTIQWTAVTGAARYELWLSNKSTGQSPVIHKADITDTKFTPTDDLQTGVYLAWLRARDDHNVPAQWSLRHTFTVTLTTPTLLSPQGTVSGTEVAFEWSTVVDAQRYELWVRNLTTGQDRVIHKTQLTTTQYTHSEQLATGDYRMWVRAFDANNIPSDWTAGDFKVAATNAPSDATTDGSSDVGDLILPEGQVNVAVDGQTQLVSFEPVLPRDAVAIEQPSAAKNQSADNPTRRQLPDNRQWRRVHSEAPVRRDAEMDLIDVILRDWALEGHEALHSRSSTGNPVTGD